MAKNFKNSAKNFLLATVGKILRLAGVLLFLGGAILFLQIQQGVFNFRPDANFVDSKLFMDIWSIGMVIIGVVMFVRGQIMVNKYASPEPKRQAAPQTAAEPEKTWYDQLRKDMAYEAEQRGRKE